MNKNAKISMIIIIAIFIICLIVNGFYKRNVSKNSTLEENEKKISLTNEAQEQDEILDEVKVHGYHLVTYDQSANQNSFLQDLTVNSKEESKIRFVIGTIDDNYIVKERTEFEVDCKNGKNQLDLSNKRYLLKEGEYLFMDIAGQDVLYKKSNSQKNALVQTESDKKQGKMVMAQSDYILPFEYTLEKVQEYNCLVIGNEITIKDGSYGAGASEETLDYYYLTKTRLEETFDKINMNRISGVDWEKSENSTDRLTWINNNLSQKTVSNLDLVIFQLGDNYNFENDFENDINEMVQAIKKYSPGVEMVFIGRWFTSNEHDRRLPGICERVGIKFIDISDLADEDEYKTPISIIEEDIQTQKYYPSNDAMQIISNRIMELLKF